MLISVASYSQKVNPKDFYGITYSALTFGATTTWDYQTGSHKTLPLTGNSTLSITNVYNGATGVLIVTQDGTGNRTLTVPDGTVTLNSGASESTTIAFSYDGSTFHWAGGKNKRGLDTLYQDGDTLRYTINGTAYAIYNQTTGGGGATANGNYGNVQLNRNSALSGSDSLTVDSSKFKSKNIIQQGNNVKNVQIFTREIPAETAGASYTDSYSIGDRTALITMSQGGGIVITSSGALNTLVNGNTTESLIWFASGGAVDGTTWIKFANGVGIEKTFVEAKFHQSATTSHGVWQWYGSHDDITYTAIGSSFTLGGSTLQIQTTLSGNTTAYRYYRLTGVSGNTSATPYIREFEFKVAGVASDDSTHAKIFTNTTGIAIGDTLTKKVTVGDHVFDSTFRVAGSQHITGTLRVDALANAVGTKAVRYNPSTGTLTYADTTLGGSTPGIDAVLAVAQNMTASRSINTTGTYKLTIDNATPGASSGFQVNLTANATDATGDLYYRTSNGPMGRIPTGTTKQALHPDGSGGYVWKDTTAVPTVTYPVQNLNSQYTDVGNVGSGEDNLMTYTLPANTLQNDGDWLEVNASFVTASNGNSKTLIFYFGTYNNTFTSPSSGARINVKIVITRTGSATQKISWSYEATGQTFPDGATASMDLTTNQVIKFTSTATADNDEVQKDMQIIYHHYAP